MKQRAHAWVALRALKLVSDSKKAPNLAELLSYYTSDVWDGAWLPDTMIVDMSYGHVFKLNFQADCSLSPNQLQFPRFALWQIEGPNHDVFEGV